MKKNILLLGLVLLLTGCNSINSKDSKEIKVKEDNKKVVEVKEEKVKDIKTDIETKEKTVEVSTTVMYSSCDLNIREGVGLESNIVDVVLVNTELNVVDNFYIGEWRRILYNGMECYVNGNFLSAEPVEIKQEVVTENIEYNQPMETESQYQVSESNNGYLGNFLITHYCNCEECCGSWSDEQTASGTYCTEGRTIAVDPNIIPLGTVVEINGYTYVAEDTGGAIKGNKIDIFVSDHYRALNMGKYYTDVYLK